MQDPRPALLCGRRILVVEDDYFTAELLRSELEAEGATVVGPAPRVGDALDLLAREAPPDAAVLDVDLDGETSCPVADALRHRNVPFVLVTGYGRRDLPTAYGRALHLHKPVSVHQLARALLGQAS